MPVHDDPSEPVKEHVLRVHPRSDRLMIVSAWHVSAAGNEQVTNITVTGKRLRFPNLTITCLSPWRQPMTCSKLDDVLSFITIILTVAVDDSIDRTSTMDAAINPSIIKRVCDIKYMYKCVSICECKCF